MQHIPLSCSKVEAGFPSPAEDYIENHISLDEQLVPKPASTFFVRVSGHSMKDAPIRDGDLAIIDRSLTPKSGSVVLAVLDGNFTIKYFFQTKEGITLEAANPDFPPIPIKEETDFQIWGVVTHVIHSF